MAIRFKEQRRLLDNSIVEPDKLFAVNLLMQHRKVLAYGGDIKPFSLVNGLAGFTQKVVGLCRNIRQTERH